MFERSSPDAWLETSDGVRTPITGVCFIGRGSSNNLVLHDNRVSARHAMIQAQAENDYWLVDLGSRNGTFVNGLVVRQACRLVDGDRIEFPGVRTVFRHPPSALQEKETTSTEERTIQDIRSMQCWLLVADIEAYTMFLQRNTPAEVAHVTGNWLATCKRMIELQGGVVNKTLGDGFLAYWLDEAEIEPRLAATLTEFRDLQSKEEPRFRIALHHGGVFMSGTSDPGEQSLLGAEVNFVFRMEKLASSLGVHRLLSETAHQRLHGHVPSEEVCRQPVPGFQGEFSFYQC